MLVVYPFASLPGTNDQVEHLDDADANGDRDDSVSVELHREITMSNNSNNQEIGLMVHSSCDDGLMQAILVSTF